MLGERCDVVDGIDVGEHDVAEGTGLKDTDSAFDTSDDASHPSGDEPSGRSAPSA